MTTPLSKTCINWCAAAACFLIPHSSAVSETFSLLSPWQSKYRPSFLNCPGMWDPLYVATNLLPKENPAFRCSSTTAIQQWVRWWLDLESWAERIFFNIKEMEAFHHSKWICLQLEDVFSPFLWFSSSTNVSSTEVLTDLCFTTAVIIPPSQYGKCVTLNRGVKITWFLGRNRD